MALAPLQTVQPKHKLALTPQMRLTLAFLSRDGASIAAEVLRLGRSNASVAVVSDAGAVAGAAGLYEHCALWIDARFDGAERRVALQFLAALEPWGWLGPPLAEICAKARVDEAAGLAILRRLQGIEPAGLFARSLAECLSLQLQSEGPQDPLMARVLDNLPRLQEQGPRALAAACGCSASDLTKCLTRLRQLDPKPGLQFGTQPDVPTRVADLIMTEQGRGWRVDLHPQATPRVVRLPTVDQAAQREADRLERAIEARNGTLLAIARHVVDAQQGYLRGDGPLRPLTMAQIAEETGRHKSTVSRILQWAVFEKAGEAAPLRSCLGARLRGRAASPGDLADAIAALVSAENPARPLSDSALADRLAQQGLGVARRTVAKYRKAAGIPAARARIGRNAGAKPTR